MLSLISFLLICRTYVKRNPDPKKWWDTVKQMAGCPKKKCFSSFVIGDQVVSGIQLAEKLMTLSYLFLKRFPHLTLSFLPIASYILNHCTPVSTEFVITEEDVYNKLSAISSSKAAGPDDIPNWILKSYVRACISSSSHFNLQRFSSTGILAVPATWKKAEIISVPKIKVPNDITKDLRPISLINCHVVKDV